MKTHTHSLYTHYLLWLGSLPTWALLNLWQISGVVRHAGQVCSVAHTCYLPWSGQDLWQTLKAERALSTGP